MEAKSATTKADVFDSPTPVAKGGLSQDGSDSSVKLADMGLGNDDLALTMQSISTEATGAMA